MGRKHTILLLLVWQTILVTGQPLPFEHLDERNGLPQLGIRSLYQGPYGFIWVGTQNGIFRFDGQTFESFYEPDGKNEINLSVIDIHGNLNSIAVLSSNQLLIIGNRNQRVSRLLLPPDLIIKPRFVCCLREEVLIGAENGLWSVNLEFGTFRSMNLTEPVTGLEMLQPGKVVISTAGSFHVYYPFIHRLVNIPYQPGSFIRHIYAEPNGSIVWVEGDSYFYRGHFIGNNLVEDNRLHLSQTSGSTSLMHFQNRYLLGLGHGLLSFDLNGREELMVHSEEDLYSLSQNQITCMLKDQQNNLWVGTSMGGINLHYPGRYKFNRISPQVSTLYGKCKEVLSFAEGPDKSILVQNTLGGLGIFDPIKKVFKKWVATGINGNCILPETDKPGSFLIGSPDGLFRYRLNEDRIIPIPTSSSARNFESDIKHMLPFGPGQYWMAGNDGLFLFDVNQKKILRSYGIGNSNLGSENIRRLYPLDPNHLLLCTAAGLYSFRINDEKFTLIPLVTGKRQPLVSSIQMDHRGDWWVGTAGLGIFLLRNKRVIDQITDKSGLTNNQIYSLLFDPKGEDCWVATNGGLSRIPGISRTPFNYGLHDGLQGIEFNESSAMMDRNGQLYFGGVNGFNYFDPNNLLTDSNEFPVVIKGLSLFNKREEFAINYRIPSEKNFVSIEFSALDYCLKKKHDFYYLVEGLQPEWTDIGERHFASFGQMKPGDYVFRVRAKTPNGAMTRSEGVVYFSIIPPYYQTWWFRLLILFLFAGVLFLLIYFRTRSAIEDEQEKGRQSKMIAELELRALRAQMDPHFIFNALNSIQDFVINNEGEQAARYLSKFARLIRMILDISEQPFISIQLEVDFLKIYLELESLRLSHEFIWKIEVDPELEMLTQIPALLIQPHVENAIWHGLQHKKGPKNLIISLKYLPDDFLVVEIEDNGVGRQEAEKIKSQRTNLYRSRAAKNTEERIHSLNVLFGSKPRIQIIDLIGQNNVACGTKVTMQIPVIHG